MKSEESCDSQKDLSSAGQRENAPEASSQMKVVQLFLLLKGWRSTRELIQERSMTNVQNVMNHSIKLVISNNT